MKKAYRTFILTICFAVLFTQFVKLEYLLYFVLPTGFHDYPRPSTISDFEYIGFKLLFNYIIPLLFGVLLVVFVGLADKIQNKKGFLLLQIAVIIWILRIVILYLTTFVQGGGATFVAAFFLSMLSIPLKIMGLIGLIMSFSSNEKKKIE